MPDFFVNDDGTFLVNADGTFVHDNCDCCCDDDPCRCHAETSAVTASITGLVGAYQDLNGTWDLDNDESPDGADQTCLWTTGEIAAPNFGVCEPDPPGCVARVCFYVRAVCVLSEWCGDVKLSWGDSPLNCGQSPWQADFQKAAATTTCAGYTGTYVYCASGEGCVNGCSSFPDADLQGGEIVLS